jgi:protoporphyrinogen oxidase
MNRVVVVGAGLTGLAAAGALRASRAETLILERNRRIGGLCSSFRCEGYTFDYTGHFLHLRDPRVRSLVDRGLAGNLATVNRRAGIRTRHASSGDGVVPFPLQAHLAALNPDRRFRCIHDLLRAHFEGTARGGAVHAGAEDSFSQWVRARFGNEIARVFFEPYNRKIWRHPLETVPVAWAGRFVPVPRPLEILGNCISGNVGVYGYNASFLYPLRGGIQPLADLLADRLDRTTLRTGTEVVAVRHRRRTVILSDGSHVGYRCLVSTMPLAELVLRGDFPDALKSDARSLRWTGVLCFNVALANPTRLRHHWLYFPDADVPFYRVGMYHNVVAGMVPRGAGSLYVELSYLPGRRPELSGAWRSVLRGLVSSRVIASPAEVRFFQPLDIPCAYVVYRHDTPDVVSRIQRYLSRHGIISTGRYGAWKYSFMEEDILDGWDAADRARAQVVA